MIFRRPSIIGAAAVLFVWLCQALTVHFNYGGNWTGLFCIAPHMPVPTFLKSENLYIFHGTTGYDGQVFHLMAHDPWMQKGSPAAIAGAGFRYQRIFVPALAWIIALGNDQWIHAAYIAVTLAFIFLGVYWLAQFVERRGAHPVWGLAFLVAPATITSADRLVTDAVLAALCVGFALFADTAATWKVAVLLACAILTKETGLFLAAGYCTFLLTRFKIVDTVIAAGSVIPAFAWLLYVRNHVPVTMEPIAFVGGLPLQGLLYRFLHPTPYHFAFATAVLATIFDYIALIGIAITLILAARMAFVERRWNPRAAAIYGLALATSLIINKDVWVDAYGYARILTPLLLLAAMERVGPRPLVAFAPMFMASARIFLDLGRQVIGTAYGVFK